jgi:hypothetical protein
LHDLSNYDLSIFDKYKKLNGKKKQTVMRLNIQDFKETEEIKGR